MGLPPGTVWAVLNGGQVEIHFGRAKRAYCQSLGRSCLLRTKSTDTVTLRPHWRKAANQSQVLISLAAQTT